MSKISVILVLSLSACTVAMDDSGLHITKAPAPRTSPSQFVEKFEQELAKGRDFAAGDLDNAIAKAHASGNKVMEAFWRCFLPITVTPHPDKVGIATGLMDADIAYGCLPASNAFAVLP